MLFRSGEGDTGDGLAGLGETGAGFGAKLSRGICGLSTGRYGFFPPAGGVGTFGGGGTGFAIRSNTFSVY